MTHKRCPECNSKILADSTSCRCGWQANGAKRELAGPARCAFDMAGTPCPCVGVVAFTTAGGPWYCREHADVIQGRRADVVGNQLPKRSQSLAVREWHAAMARHRAAQERTRQEAQGAAVHREPGEDREELVEDLPW